MAKGIPISEVDLRKLKVAVEQRGEGEILKRLGCTRQTLYRAMAGLPVYAGTANSIKLALQKR